MLATALLHRDARVLRHLGLWAPVLLALGAALVFALPMLVGGWAVFGLNLTLGILNLIARTIGAGFFEELYFRGFLFGQLYRKTRLGFVPAIAACSLFFAAAHLYQSQDPATLVGVFFTTFMGSALFAWLLVEWDDNLWVPIWLHTLMNLSWHLFSMGDTALGSVWANVLRALTIAASIVLTIGYRQGWGVAIGREQLFWRKTGQPDADGYSGKSS
ncbi:MAG: hypothetical protein OHK0039_28670 [Bacteroidia bacterium]